jgi:hypothetical protein
VLISSGFSRTQGMCTQMSAESWLKIALPAFPLGFTILGIGLYWRENPIALLPPPLAFWGLVILFYLFSHLYVPNRRYPLIMMILGTTLWLLASITSHNLAKFLTSSRHAGFFSVLSQTDFWYSYACAGVGAWVGIRNFLRFEPSIVSQIREDRETIDQG